MIGCLFQDLMGCAPAGNGVGKPGQARASRAKPGQPKGKGEQRDQKRWTGVALDMSGLPTSASLANVFETCIRTTRQPDVRALPCLACSLLLTQHYPPCRVIILSSVWKRLYMYTHMYVLLVHSIHGTGLGHRHRRVAASVCLEYLVTTVYSSLILLSLSWAVCCLVCVVSCSIQSRFIILFLVCEPTPHARSPSCASMIPILPLSPISHLMSDRFLHSGFFIVGGEKKKKKKR